MKRTRIPREVREVSPSKLDGATRWLIAGMVVLLMAVVGLGMTDQPDNQFVGLESADEFGNPVSADLSYDISALGWASWVLIGGVILFVIAYPKGIIKKKHKPTVKMISYMLIIVGIVFVLVMPLLASMMVGVGYQADFTVDITQQTDTGKWDDNIYTDVDLWATGEGSCNNLQKICTVLVSATMSPSMNPSNNTVAPDEVLLSFNVKRNDDNPDIPNDEDYANLYIQFTSSVPVMTNSSSGDSAYMFKQDSYGQFYIWIYDQDDTSRLISPGEKVSLGLFQPSDSDADLRFGFVLEPEAWGYDPFDVGATWQVGLIVGNVHITINLQLYAQS